jgi:quercetin dioxygenase-like cupin family protein
MRSGNTKPDMSIPHAGSGDTIDVRPFGADLPGRRTVALFKSEDLEVIRLVLLAGKSLPPHKVPGEITIQCIEGRLDVTVDGSSHLLQAGELLFLIGHVQHGVLALEDSSALVTITLRNPPA